MTAAAMWWVNPVQVKTYLGSGGTGDLWADPVSMDCWVEDGAKLVINPDGQEVVSSAAVHGPLDQAGMFTVGSIVITATGGPESRVITLDRFDSGTLAFPVDHFVAHLN